MVAQHPLRLEATQRVPRGFIETSVMSLDCQGRTNAITLIVLESKPRAVRPVVHSSFMTSQATLKEVGVLPDIVQKPGHPSLLPRAEHLCVSCCPRRHGLQMLVDGLGNAGIIGGMGKRVIRHDSPQSGRRMCLPWILVPN